MEKCRSAISGNYTVDRRMVKSFLYKGLPHAEEPLVTKEICAEEEAL
ncbi:MAG: hypothetical protein II936_05730 [Oscillospiraceae bacterium]|nr:hypothetical protein [Oscillospiraceae bacterium]